jgi:hypothetical protein
MEFLKMFHRLNGCNFWYSGPVTVVSSTCPPTFCLTPTESFGDEPFSSAIASFAGWVLIDRRDGCYVIKFVERARMAEKQQFKG